MAKAKKAFYFRSWFISQARNAMRRYPPYYQARNAVKEEYFIPSKTGKPMKRVRFTCASCGGKFNSNNIVVDHRIPVVEPTTGFPLMLDGNDDWSTYLSRLFCPIENLQVLCKNDHDIKSGKETKQRVKARKKKVLTT